MVRILLKVFQLLFIVQNQPAFCAKNLPIRLSFYLFYLGNEAIPLVSFCFNHLYYYFIILLRLLALLCQNSLRFSILLTLLALQTNLLFDWNERSLKSRYLYNQLLRSSTWPTRNLLKILSISGSMKQKLTLTMEISTFLAISATILKKLI